MGRWGGRGKEIRNKNKRQSKRGKEGGKTQITVVRDALVPMVDFVAMEKNTKVGEKWEPCEAHSRSIGLKINIIFRFNFSTVNH